MADILGALFPTADWHGSSSDLGYDRCPLTSWTYDTHPFYQGVVILNWPYGHRHTPTLLACLSTSLAWPSIVRRPIIVGLSALLVYVGQVTGMVNPVVTTQHSIWRSRHH